MISNHTTMITYKFAIFLCVFLTLFFLASAAYLLTGNGDWMINNFRNLPEERRAQINIFRLRKVTAAMLVFIAVLIPFNFLAKTDTHHLIITIVTAIGLVAFLLVARLWANMPLFHNPIGKK